MPSAPKEPAYVRRRREAKGEADSAAQTSRRERLITALGAIGRQLRRWRVESGRLDAQKSCIDRGNLVVQLVIGAGIWLTIVASWYFNHQTLSEMQAERRPWVNITGKENFRLTFQAEVVGKMAADASEFLHVQNTGATPALHVRAHAYLTTEPLRKPGDTLASFSRAACLEADNSTNRDVTVFPSGGAVAFSSARWRPGEEHNEDRESLTNLSVYGCLAYDDSSGGTHHTGFSFGVYKPVPITGGRVAQLPVVIPPGGGLVEDAAADPQPNWATLVTFTD